MKLPKLSPDGQTLLALWARLSPLPGGRGVFSLLLGRMVPYSGSLCARVRKLAPGDAEIELRDRPRLRNHLQSLHAAALMNALEMASGLAVITAVPAGGRAILTAFELRYLKKGRGTLVGSGSIVEREGPYWRARGELRNEAGELVAEATATWKVG